MLDLLILEWEQFKIERHYFREHKKIVQRNGSEEEVHQLKLRRYREMHEIEIAFDALEGNRLLDEARSLDVERPSLKDTEMWHLDKETSIVWLSSKGRAHLRKLVDEEKNRRFKVWTKWVKLFTPIIVALVAALVTYIVAYKFHAK
ncbi:MAG TPA: hypothetical protein VGZ48_07365 [Candidatus Acidoferrales bacterium]|jgi:hypothetical protein|nr:hypothetical protein [Candidatus Acidoferrales bacterium]